jgi:hypothetical protein
MQKGWLEFDDPTMPSKARIRAILGINWGSMKKEAAGATGVQAKVQNV